MPAGKKGVFGLAGKGNIQHWEANYRAPIGVFYRDGRSQGGAEGSPWSKTTLWSVVVLWTI